MFIVILATVAFLGGVYVGARWAEKLRDIYFSIVSK